MEPTPRRAAPSATKKGKAIMSNPLFSGTRLDLVLFLLDGTLKQGLTPDLALLAQYVGGQFGLDQAAAQELILDAIMVLVTQAEA